MNDILQTILAFVALGLALSFLIKKFFWKKSKSKKAKPGRKSKVPSLQKQQSKTELSF